MARVLSLEAWPEKEKSTDKPWYGTVAVIVLLLPAPDLVCLARMHVGHVSNTGVSCAKRGTPLTCLCAS